MNKKYLLLIYLINRILQITALSGILFSFTMVIIDNTRWFSWFVFAIFNMLLFFVFSLFSLIRKQKFPLVRIDYYNGTGKRMRNILTAFKNFNQK